MAVDPDTGMEYGGGAIDTDEPQAAAPQPAAPGPAIDTTGEGDNPAPQAQEEQPSTGPRGPIARGVKSIVSYLMGAGADHPAALDKAGAAVDPRGSMSPDDRNLIAVQRANEAGGPEAAWKLVQANRVAYNAKQAFAYTAMNGTPQKPADINAAVDAANQAASHVLDGSSVKFSPSQNGVTATVTAAGGAQPQTYNLSPDQFKQYLNVGGAGQWDRMMETSVPKTLAMIAQTSPAAGSAGPINKLSQMRPKAGPPAAGPGDNSESDAYTPPTPQTNFGTTPSTQNLSGNTDVSPPQTREGNYDPETEARAMRMFPSVSQGQQREQWMAAQEQRQDELQNKVDVAHETGENRVKVARETGASREKTAQISGQLKKEGWQYANEAKKQIAQAQLAQKISQQEQSNGNQAQTRALKAIQTKIISAQPLTPQEQSYMDTLPGAGQAGAKVTAPGQHPQQPQAQQPQAQQPPEPGAKLYKGQWYKRGPNGESVPVQ